MQELTRRAQAQIHSFKGYQKLFPIEQGHYDEYHKALATVDAQLASLSLKEQIPLLAPSPQIAEGPRSKPDKIPNLVDLAIQMEPKAKKLTSTQRRRLGLL